MATELTTFDTDLGIIDALPLVKRNLSPAEAEAYQKKYDEGPKAIQTFINETLIPEMETAIDAATIDRIERIALFGDVNGDEAVDSSDIGAITDHINGTYALDNPAVADVNMDGVVDNSDKALISQYILHEISALPVGGDATSYDYYAVYMVDGTWKWLAIAKSTGDGSGAVDSVNGATGTVVLDADDIDDTSTTNKFVTATDLTNLGNLSGTNTGDQDISGKADKVTSPTAGNFAGLDAGGNLTDSGHKDADYADASHAHGNITNAGAIGSTAGLMIKTTTSGVLTALAAGTSGQYLKHDGTWDTPPDTNTTYSAADFDIKDLTDSTSLRTTWSAKQDALGFTAVPDTRTVNSKALSDNITLTADDIGDGTTNKAYTATEKTKLAGIAESANAYTHPNHSGDVTSSGDGAQTIANGAVTLAKMANMATASLIYRKTAGDGAPEVNTLATLKTDLGLPYNATINFIIDGGGSAITTGIKGDAIVDFACTIQSVTVLADQTGSIAVDIWKDTYANFPPTDADSITASAPPTLSSAAKSRDATLTGWTTSISAGDVLRFNVDSATTVKRVTVSLKVVRT